MAVRLIQQPWFDEGNFSFSGLATYDPAISSSTGIGLADFYLGRTSSYSLNIGPRAWENAVGFCKLL